MKSVVTDDSSPTRDHETHQLVQPSPVAPPVRPLLPPPAGELVGDIERDPTVISQRPVAAPAEFARSLSLVELGRSLEGRQLDHFAVGHMIGGGGMGAVFRGRDLRLDRDVAIKVIPESRRDPETLRRFRMEAQSAARLDHPNIARVYDIGEDEAWNYIVFEFIDGINLRDLVQVEGPMGIDDAVFTTRQVAEALQHAHDRDVVHRDIKPSNVIITPTGVAKVVDMGLARNTALDRSAADQTASGVTLGTFDYISPEQARDPRDADVRSDLYSLGCTLFYMLTGQAPFPDGTALQKLLNHGSQPPPDPRQWRDDISDQLYAVLAKLMAKRPTDRYQKPLELINDLLLIAQLESLPRSRTAGTILLRPTVAQRSLTETHLPWLVPLSVLLLTAFWMQSADSLTAPLELPTPLFNTAQAADLAPQPAGLAESHGTTLVPGDPRQPGSGNPPLQPPDETPTAVTQTQRSALPEPPREPLPTAPRVPSDAEATFRPPYPAQSANGPDSLKSPGPVGASQAAGIPEPLESLMRSAASAVNELRERASGASSAVPTAEPALAPSDPGASIVGPASLGTNAAVAKSAAATPSPTNNSVPTTGLAPLPVEPRTSEIRPPDLRTLAAFVRDTIVVSGLQPDDLSGNALWCSSLPEALMQASMLPDVRVIELRESIELDRAITLPRSGLVLRSAPGSAVEVVMTGQQAYGMGWETWIDIGRLSLRCEGLRFTCRNDMRQTQAVFAMRAGGQLALNDCVVTMAENHEAPLGIGILISETDRATGASLPATAAGSVTASSLVPLIDHGPVSIAIRNSLVRGHQTVVAMRTACRTEFTFEDSSALVEGRLLTIRALEPDRMPPVVRLRLEQSTLVCAQGFAAVQTSFAQRAPLTLMRTAKLCAFWSPIMVPHIAVDGIANEEMLDELLQLRGEENAYDQNIETLCQCRFADGKHIDFSFRDATGEWFRELGNDNSLRWQNIVPPDRAMEEQLPEDYRLRAGMFMPGFPSESLPAGSAPSAD